MYRKSCPWPPVCNNCKEAKPVDQFSPKSRDDLTQGFKQPCKECRRTIRLCDPRTKEYAKRGYYKDPVKSREASKRNVKAFLLRHPKNRFSKISFKNCAYCNSEFININKCTKYCSDSCRKALDAKYDHLKYKQARYKDIDKVREKERINKRNKIFKLNDCYIKDKLTQGNLLNFTDIPQSLIELKRVQLMARRLTKK